MEPGNEAEALVHEEGQAQVPTSSWLGGRGVRAPSLLCASVLLVAGAGAVWWRGDQRMSTRGVIGRNRETVSESADDTADSHCSRDGTDCRSSRCCLKEGNHCYRKNNLWASCNESCTHTKQWDPRARKWSYTGHHVWDCTVLSPLPTLISHSQSSHVAHIQSVHVQPSVDRGTCPHLGQPHQALWGLFMDGRDASHGRCGYGCQYADSMTTALKGMYRMLDRKELPVDRLTVHHFHRIKDMTHRDWRNFDNPAAHQVRSCHSVMHHEDVRHIMQDITTINRWSYQPGHPVDYDRVLSGLFHTYNQGVAEAATTDDLLKHLARLLRDIAFIHPLTGGNGRSRLLLLQYELRRLNIACGAMMWNNNKDMYFDTLETTILKIKEGIEVFQEASQEGFAENPWSRQATIDRHFQRFPLRDTDAALLSCWDRHCAKQPNAALRAEEQKQLEMHGLHHRRLASIFCAGTSPI